MPHFNPEISYFKNARSNVPVIFPNGSQQPTHALLGAIRDGLYINEVQAIRNSTDKKERDELKKALPAVTWAGTFSKRNSKDITSYSNIICHDIDKLTPEQLAEYSQQLREDAYVYAFFVSPSGNGLKVLFRIEENEFPLEHITNKHESHWLAIGNYLKNNYNIDIDEKCKDICRLCFCSYDPELHLNEDALIFNNDLIHAFTWTPEAQKVKVPKKLNETDARTWIERKCNEICEKKGIYAADGSYNRYINCFAIFANRYGLSKDETARAIAGFCGWNGPDKNDTAVINSVFQKFSAESGKWLDSEGKATRRASTTPAELPNKFSENLPPAEETAVSPFDERILFWYGVETGKQTKEGKDIMEYKFSYNKAIIFLQNNGYYKYRIEKSRFQFIHIEKEKKIVEIVDEGAIFDFFIEFLTYKTRTATKDDEAEMWQVLEMFRRGRKNYCSVNVLEGLEYKTPQLKRNTKDRGFVYFKNCFVEINKEGIHTQDYSAQDGYVWKKKVKDFDFSLSNEVSEFEKYVCYAITGKGPRTSKNFVDFATYYANDLTDQDRTKIESVRSSIGYMVHKHKNAALTKALIATDKKIRSIGDANGGTGKSLMGMAFAKMLTTIVIDARNFKFDYEFAFQLANIDTELVIFDDIPKNFDFSRLFGIITGDFTFNKKRLDSVTVPFEDGPFFYLTANFSLKGDGESFKRRQQIKEFSDYFNSNHTPQDEFGHLFFTEWDKAEWGRFYSFMCRCVQKFLNEGLLKFPLENYGLNKLLDTCGEEMVDYMDDAVRMNTLSFRHNLKELYKNYLDNVRPQYPPKQNTWSKWAKMWADVRNLEWNAHKKDKDYRDKSGHIDYVTFTLRDGAALPTELMDDSGTMPLPTANEGYVEQILIKNETLDELPF